MKQQKQKKTHLQIGNFWGTVFGAFIRHISINNLSILYTETTDKVTADPSAVQACLKVILSWSCPKVISWDRIAAGKMIVTQDLK